MIEQANPTVDAAVRQETIVRRQMQALLSEIVRTLQLVGNPSDKDAVLKPAIGILVVYDAQAVALALASGYKPDQLAAKPAIATEP